MYLSAVQPFTRRTLSCRVCPLERSRVWMCWRAEQCGKRTWKTLINVLIGMQPLPTEILKPPSFCSWEDLTGDRLICVCPISSGFSCKPPLVASVGDGWHGKGLRSDPEWLLGVCIVGRRAALAFIFCGIANTRIWTWVLLENCTSFLCQFMGISWLLPWHNIV